MPDQFQNPYHNKLQSDPDFQKQMKEIGGTTLGEFNDPGGDLFPNEKEGKKLGSLRPETVNQYIEAQPFMKRQNKRAECTHHFIQYNEWWTKCNHCGMMEPLKQ